MIFVRAWQKLGTFRGESKFGTWLHRVAINVILGRRSSLKIERARRVEGEEVFETLMAAPLIVRGLAVGVLVVQTRDARQFEKADVDTLQTCAQLIAPIVVNAQMI